MATKDVLALAQCRAESEHFLAFGAAQLASQQYTDYYDRRPDVLFTATACALFSIQVGPIPGVPETRKNLTHVLQVRRYGTQAIAALGRSKKNRAKMQAVARWMRLVETGARRLEPLVAAVEVETLLWIAPAAEDPCSSAMRTAQRADAVGPGVARDLGGWKTAVRRAAERICEEKVWLSEKS